MLELLLDMYEIEILCCEGGEKVVGTVTLQTKFILSQNLALACFACLVRSTKMRRTTKRREHSSQAREPQKP